jgi:tetratricopeptide (TPR) repeat protein
VSEHSDSPFPVISPNVIEKIQNAQDAIKAGLMAYRSADYVEAIDYLSRGLNVEEDYWFCHLYLAMAYFRVGEMAKCKKEFDHVLNWCPNQALRNKAIQALKALDPNLGAGIEEKKMGRQSYAEDYGWQ